MVERPAHNRLVVGSNPAGPTKTKLMAWMQMSVGAEFLVAGMLSKQRNRPHNVISFYR